MLGCNQRCGGSARGVSVASLLRASGPADMTAALNGAPATSPSPPAPRPSARETVREAAGLRDALGAARREAGASFGNDTLYIERLIEQPRHVEIQVFADGHGHTVHVFEREWPDR